MRESTNKTLLVIGNGLDTGLGYPSSYKYLYKYLKIESTRNKSIKQEFKYVNSICTLFDIPSKNNLLWYNFEERLPNANFSKINKPGLYNFNGIGDHLWNTIKNLFIFWTKHLEKQIGKNAPDHKSKEFKLIKNLINKSNLFLTFNYTKTLEKYFNVNNKNILHIHNYYDDPKIGHAPNSYNYIKIPSDDENVSPANSLYVRSTNSSLNEQSNAYIKESTKPTLSIYRNKRNLRKNWFNNLKNIKKIIFFGVSYSKVDEPYYTYIKNNYFKDHDIKATFYYFSSDDKKRAISFYNYLYNKIYLIKREKNPFINLK